MNVEVVGKAPKAINYCKMHCHKGYEIVVITKGNGTVETPQLSSEFSIGDLYIMPPETAHTTISDNSFKDIYIQSSRVDLPITSLTVIHNSGKEFISLAKTIYDIYLKREQGYYGALDCIYKALIELVTNMLAENSNYKFTGEIRDYIAHNFWNSGINLETLSRHFGYNSDYLRRCFKADFAITPSAYLCSLRIDNAKNLLLNMQSYTIEEIATLCGFTDPFYFSRCFKKSVGVSPQMFKKRNE